MGLQREEKDFVEQPGGPSPQKRIVDPVRFKGGNQDKQSGNGETNLTGERCSRRVTQRDYANDWNEECQAVSERCKVLQIIVKHTVK